MGIKEAYLDERFSSSAVEHPPLPFFHCCEALYLQDILDGRALKPRPCNEYAEDLLYLFYGKPAYKSAEQLNSRFNFMMPVCFIIKNEAIKHIRRAVAFDSGAFKKYVSCLHPAMRREGFHLTPNKAVLNKMVDYFFSDNDCYFEGHAKEIIDYDSMHFQIESYHSIITGGYRSEVDDRKATIEVQLDYELRLNSDNIEAIILPNTIAQSPFAQSVLVEELGIKIIPITNYGVASNEYYVHLLDKTRKLLVEKKLMNGN